MAAHAPRRDHRSPEGRRRAHGHARPHPRRAGPPVAGGVRQAVRRSSRTWRRWSAQASQLPSNDERLAAAIATAPVIIGLAGETAGDKPPPKPHASFVIAGDDPLQFVPQFRRHRREPAGADQGGARPRRRQLAARARPGRAPRAAAAVDRRHALSVAAAGDAARRAERDDGVRALVRRQQRHGLRPAHRHRARARRQDGAADRRRRRAVAALHAARCAPLHLRPPRSRRHARRQGGRRPRHPRRHQRRRACSTCGRRRSIPPCRASRCTPRRWSRCSTATI